MEPLIRDAARTVTATLNLLKNAADSGVKRIIFAPSSAVYGGTNSPEKSEDDISIRGRARYGISKLLGECYAGFYCEVYGRERAGIRSGALNMVMPISTKRRIDSAFPRASLSRKVLLNWLDGTHMTGNPFVRCKSAHATFSPLSAQSSFFQIQDHMLKSSRARE